MRFNDLMQTVLAAGDRSGRNAVTLWRQCVDLLAQHDRHDRPPLYPRERAALMDRLTELRGSVSETQRIATVVELGNRLRSTTLIEFFAGDRPAIAAAAMARAQLPDRLWVGLLPRLTPTARGVLRGRRDIGEETRQALQAFGPTDLVLTMPQAEATETPMALTSDMVAALEPGLAEAESVVTRFPGMSRQDSPSSDSDDQIRNLVERIERFTSVRRPPEPLPDAAPARPAARDTREFAFETDAAGTILWVDRGPRAALIGLSIGEIAPDGASGPDGHIAGAFARRSGFQNGRFSIVGGIMAGEWRITATPSFDPASGRFHGYRGQARRPHLHEVAPEPRDEAGFAGMSPDSLRQLVHELRTPLNAILGFAEIIEQQLFGATGPEYREMAGKIAVDARHLLAAFDDLDLAARVARGDSAGEVRSLDPALLITQAAARYHDPSDGRAPRIDIALARDLPPVRLDPVQGERMVQHLLRTLMSVAAPGETLAGAVWHRADAGDGHVALAIDRPANIAGLEEAQLLDPGYTSDGEWADGPLLGMGFSLRLIRSLAAESGGELTVGPTRLVLTMPAMRVADAASEAKP